MSHPFRITGDKQENYTCLLLNSHLPYIYLGTTRGCLQIWNIDEQKLIAELRYLEIDDFGEQIPVDDPVVSISPNNDFTLLYVLMGNAAYCVDVEFRTIVQQIPISERVVAGSVSHNTGNIGVITQVGYLSEWSPKFYERIASHELMVQLEDAFIFYGPEEQLILVLQDRVLIFGISEDKKYMSEIASTELPLNLIEHLGPFVFDRTDDLYAHLSDNVVIIDNLSNLPSDISPIFKEGKPMAIELLLTAIDEINPEKQIIEDFRLSRRGIDRYTAEVDAVTESHRSSQASASGVPTSASQAQASSNDDSKTLSYAFEEFISDDIHNKSVASGVIDTIAARHNVSSKYLQLGWRWGAASIIEFGRDLESKTASRENKIKNYLFYILILLSAELIFSFSLFSFFSFYFQLACVIYSYFTIWKWRFTNTDPVLTWLEDYVLARRLAIIGTSYVLYRLISLYTPLGTFLPDL